MTDTAGHGADKPRRVKMADIAEAAGVSRPLVSMVLRDAPGASAATRERVKRIAREMGYVPDERARKLRQGSSHLIGIVFELQQPFHGDVVEQLYVAAKESGYDVALSAVAPTRDESAALDSLLRERCDCVIVMGTTSDPALLKAYARELPLVTVARRFKKPTFGVSRGNDQAGMRMAVKYLAELGHRRIAHIDGADAPGSADRRTSYRRTMQTLGLGAHIDVVSGGLTETDGAAGLATLLARTEPPTAVVAFNDRCASGVLDHAVRAGIDVPGQLSVMGYDDSRLARLGHVQMTTVAQSTTELAQAAVTIALEMVAGGAPREIVVSPQLIIRETTAAPGAATFR